MDHIGDEDDPLAWCELADEPDEDDLDLAFGDAEARERAELAIATGATRSLRFPPLRPIEPPLVLGRRPVLDRREGAALMLQIRAMEATRQRRNAAELVRQQVREQAERRDAASEALRRGALLAEVRQAALEAVAATEAVVCFWATAAETKAAEAYAARHRRKT